VRTQFAERSLVTSAVQASHTAATIEAGSELRAALASCRSALVGIAIFSGLINLLGLTGSLFMLEVYDRVLPSRSVPTLVGLAIITALLFIFQGILELTRGRMLVRIGNQIDWRLSDRVYDLVVRLPLRTRGSGDGLQPIRDLDTIRPGCVVRPAMAAVLSGDLLCVPPADRRDCAGRSARAGDIDASH
jgi:ATP-binding cassette subfamily C protein